MAATDRVGVLLTGVGKRYDIVSAFAQHALTVAADPNPLAPAQYAAHHRHSVPRIDDPEYVPALQELCERYGVGAPSSRSTDLDLEVLGRARAAASAAGVRSRRRDRPRDVRQVRRARAARAPRAALAPDRAARRAGRVLPGDGQAAAGIGCALDSPRRRRPAMRVLRRLRQGADDGAEVHGWPRVLDRLLCDLDGRCLNAIPRTMIESRGGESIKGKVIEDRELVDLGALVTESLGVRGPCTIQVFRDREIGLGITDVNTRFGGAFPAPMYAALPGAHLSGADRTDGARRADRTARWGLPAGMTFTRYYWQLELDAELRPTGRDIVAPPGPPPPTLARLAAGERLDHPVRQRLEVPLGRALARVPGQHRRSLRRGVVERRDRRSRSS